MLLTITTTHQPATDLGYLLRKNPARVQSFDQSFGVAHVFYPEATDTRCTAALLLEVDPVGLVRNRRGPAGEGRSLEQYVNDRPYVGSSFLSVVIADVFSSAMAGSSKERPELANAAIPFKATLSCIEFHLSEHKRRGFHSSQLIDYTLEPNPDAGEDKNEPPQKLALAFSTADVVVLGWRLGLLADKLQENDLAAVRALAKRYAEVDRHMPFVASINITPIAKG